MVYNYKASYEEKMGKRKKRGPLREYFQNKKDFNKLGLFSGVNV